MSAAAWPPPATPARPWTTRSLRVRGPEFGDAVETVELEVREVRPWGKTVLLTRGEDSIWCPHRHRLTPIGDPAVLSGHINADRGAVFRFRSEASRQGPFDEGF